MQTEEEEEEEEVEQTGFCVGMAVAQRLDSSSLSLLLLLYAIIEYRVLTWLGWRNRQFQLCHSLPLCFHFMSHSKRREYRIRLRNLVRRIIMLFEVYIFSWKVARFATAETMGVFVCFDWLRVKWLDVWRASQGQKQHFGGKINGQKYLIFPMMRPTSQGSRREMLRKQMRADQSTRRKTRS